MRRITSDLSNEDERPWFLWDEDLSVRELRERLRGADAFERDRLFGKMLR